MLGFAARLIAILSSAQIPDSSMPGPDEVITCARMQTIWSGLINRYLDALDRYLDCVTGAEPGGGSGLANAITGILSGSTEEDPPYEPPKDCSVEARILDEIVKEMADAAVAVSYICRNE